MKIDINGEKIKLTNTVLTDIDKIIEIEKSNNHFVNQYPKDKHIALLTDKDCMHLSLKSLDNDRLVGFMVIFGLLDQSKVLEFRRIAIEEKGLGFGREAIKILKKICFKKLKFHRLWLDVFDDNERAINLYESEGFVKEGTLRDSIKKENIYRSQRIYAMLENEFN